VDGHRIVIEVDGIAVNAAVPIATQLSLQELALGSHRIRALIQDTNAVTVSGTSPVNVHVLRPVRETAQP